MQKETREIITIEEDEALPDEYGLERFMEEVNILELEGVYFCPNRKEAGKRAKRTISVEDMSGRPITVAITDYGQPGELSYKVLQVAFLKLQDQGQDTTGVIPFSRRELTRLLRITYGGKQSKALYTAIKQLQRTEIACSIRYKVRKNGRWEREWRARSFTIFTDLAFEGSERGRFSRVAVTIHDLVIQNFKNRHVSYFNFERMHGLDMVGMMLYKRFFRHMANIYRDGMNRNALKFEKDYEQVCATWLGLKPFTQRSRILKQLSRSLDALKEVRLLREWRLESKADGAGFKIVAYAGSGFFKDYQGIYRKTLPVPTAHKIEPEPLLYLCNFHRHLGHQQEEFPPKEVAYARQLLCRYTPDEVRDLVAFGLQEAAKTNFNMQWFSALSLYEKRWLAQRRKTDAAAAVQKVIAACRFCNEHGYLEFTDGSVGPCPHESEKVALTHLRKPIRGFHQA